MKLWPPDSNRRGFLASSYLIVFPDESRGYLGISTVTLPPQRFPFRHDNLKIILVRPFKLVCGYIWAMPQTLLFCDLDLQFQGHWWPLKGQILAIFSHFGPVLIYRKLDHIMAGIKNIYMSSVSMPKFDLEALPHPQIAKVPHQGHFWPFWRYFHT